MQLEGFVEVDALTGRPLFLAGQKVLPGRYLHLQSGREVVLDRADLLPASLDGRVACYVYLGPNPASSATSKANSAQSAAPRPRAMRAVSRL